MVKNIERITNEERTYRRAHHWCMEVFGRIPTAKELYALNVNHPGVMLLLTHIWDSDKFDRYLKKED